MCSRGEGGVIGRVSVYRVLRGDRTLFKKRKVSESIKGLKGRINGDLIESKSWRRNKLVSGPHYFSRVMLGPHYLIGWF